MIDKREFITLVQENQNIIFKVIGLYTDTKEDREDLYQETLLQLWKSLQNFKGESSFTTWMYRVTLNVALNFRRNLSKVKTESLDSIYHIKEEFAQKESYEILYLLIKKLPETDRMIITLHLDGYSNDEIANIIGVSKNNIGVKIHRVKDRISKLYEQLHDGHQ